jgi:hypothetical protein
MSVSTAHDHRHSAGFRSDPWSLKVAWIVLVVLSAFLVLAPLLDIVSDHSSGLPSDHHAAFAKLTGQSWNAAKASAPGVTNYVTQLEYGYALHELTFALLFLAIVVVPFRRRQTWAWWACWAVMIANVGYAVTIAHYDPTLLRRSLIGVIVLPLALVVFAPSFWRTARSRNGAKSLP